MATAKNTASTTRKAPAKRGPTKAAALKALGLTQEDLDNLKQLREIEAVGLAAYQEEQYPSHIPSDGDYITRSGNTIQPTAASGGDLTGTYPNPVMQTQLFYARNLRNVELGLRIDRQETGSKRFNFKARGMRGDILPLQKDDLNDTTILQNIGLTIEIITEAEAREAISKQNINVQRAVHPAMAMLRNELGEEYGPGAVQVTEEYNQQGQVVAQLSPQGGGAGLLPSQGRGVDWNAIHSTIPGASAVVAPGGNPQNPSGIGPPPAGLSQDAIARTKGLEGPAAGGITSVTVLPPTSV